MKNTSRVALRILPFAFIWIFLFNRDSARAQDNYEIQVYPSETMAPKTLLMELHSNFTAEGSTTSEFGMLPSQHQEHETLELTQGINCICIGTRSRSQASTEDLFQD